MKTFLLSKHQAFIIPCLRHMWIKAQRHIESIERLFGTSKRIEHRPFAVPRRSIVRVQLQRSLKCHERILVALQRTQRRSFAIPGNNQRWIQL